MFLLFRFGARKFVLKSSFRQRSANSRTAQFNLNSSLTKQQYQSVYVPRLGVQIPRQDSTWVQYPHDFTFFQMDPFRTSQVHMSLLQQIPHHRALLRFLLLNQSVSGVATIFHLVSWSITGLDCLIFHQICFVGLVQITCLVFQVKLLLAD